MSKRIQLTQTPATNPELFRPITSDEVKPGDIFQGERNPSKWYETDGHPENVDSWRTYYRRKDAVGGVAGASTAATSDAPIADDDIIVLGYIGPFVVKVSREGLRKAVETIDAA